MEVIRQINVEGAIRLRDTDKKHSYPIDAPRRKHYSGESKKAVTLQQHAANTGPTAR